MTTGIPGSNQMILESNGHVGIMYSSEKTGIDGASFERQNDVIMHADEKPFGPDQSLVDAKP